MWNPIDALLHPPPKVPGQERYHPVHRKWPRINILQMYCMIPLELTAIVPCLALFAIAQPDLYRTNMWQIGWDHGLNSNPSMVLYAYANHRPLPKVAFIWTRTLTDYNVALSVMALFFWLSKLTACIMKVWYPILASFINIGMVICLSVAIWGQIGPDYADSRYPAPAAWYFRYGCGLAKPYNMVGECRLAQGCLVVTFYLWAFYVVNLGFSLYAMWPNKINDVDDEDEDLEENEPKMMWEMHDMKTPMSFAQQPFTPRTQAFNTLDRQLPLRA